MFRRLAILFVLCGSLIAAEKPVMIKAGSILPLTTQSPLALDLFERAMVDYENMHIERALVGWRAAVKADPDLAVSYTMIAMNCLDPQEARSAREHANLLSAKTSPASGSPASAPISDLAPYAAPRLGAARARSCRRSDS